MQGKFYEKGEKLFFTATPGCVEKTCQKAGAIVYETLSGSVGSVTVPDRCICLLRSEKTSQDDKAGATNNKEKRKVQNDK